MQLTRMFTAYLINWYETLSIISCLTFAELLIWLIRSTENSFVYSGLQCNKTACLAFLTF